MALACLKLCASGKVMASGKKTGKGNGIITTIETDRHNRIFFTFQLPKTKETRANRDIKAPDMTN